MYMILIVQGGFALAKTDYCGVDTHPCENVFTDCAIPLPEVSMTLAEREENDVINLRLYDIQNN